MQEGEIERNWLSPIGNIVIDKIGWNFKVSLSLFTACSEGSDVTLICEVAGGMKGKNLINN